MRQKRIMAVLFTAAVMLSTVSCGNGQRIPETGSSGSRKVQEAQKEESDTPKESSREEAADDRNVPDTMEVAESEDASAGQESQEEQQPESEAANADGNSRNEGKTAGEGEAEPKEAESEEENQGSSLVDGMRPEFKEAMDSYEAFYDEYIEFMKQYIENPTDLSLLARYTDFLTRLVEMDEKFSAWEGEEMNDAELKYYLEVNGRVMQKLAEATIQP